VSIRIFVMTRTHVRPMFVSREVGVPTSL
jgi:hypothetical protein